MNIENRTLFHGDNLAYLRGINSETIDLIATDPPFNKGRDFHATPDSLAKGAKFQDRWSWEQDVHEEWVDEIADDWPAVKALIDAARLTSGDDMAAFLCWLGVRLMAMHRILKPTGSLYLHCDHTASHYLKALLDGIFGKRNFRNEIVWYYKNASRGKRQFAKSHDVVFWYTKTGDAGWNREAVLVPYESGMTAWRYRKAGKEPPKGKTPDDVIVLPSLNTMDKERTGYPTQKPLALYERIIKASSNKGDVVLDPFAGCATTCVAAERLGRQWIGMDLWDGAHDLVKQRLIKETHFTYDIHYRTDVPLRTDERDVAAPALDTPLRRQRVVPAWQKLTHAEMRAFLLDVQGVEHLTECAGCGRVLEGEFMELDHILPRVDGGENYLTNRVLLCSPCNRRKGSGLTLSGLLRENAKTGWMDDKVNAQAVYQRVKAAVARKIEE